MRSLRWAGEQLSQRARSNHHQPRPHDLKLAAPSQLPSPLRRSPGCDFLAAAAPEVQALFRSYMETIILATDVTTHIPFIKAFNATLDSTAPDAETAVNGDAASPAPGPPTPLAIAEIIIKAADVSNPARPLAVYQPWIDGVMFEFFAQGDREREQGLPLSMNCDRHTVDVNKCQVGFISFIVAPVYAALARYVPELQASLVTQLEANKQHFASAGTS